MKDIVPYTQPECEILGRALPKLGVCCIGPGEGISLAKVADSVRIAIDTNTVFTKDELTVLEGYRARIMDICLVSAYHQQAVIGALEKAVNAT